MMSLSFLLQLLLIVCCYVSATTSLSLRNQHHHLLYHHHYPATSSQGGTTSRRQVVEQSWNAALAAAVVSVGASPTVASAVVSAAVAEGTVETAPTGVAARLLQRDPALLGNRLFNNRPPGVQKYPEWMAGHWAVTSSFQGFVFPSNKIPKAKVIADFVVPGFQKCSIASIADIGKESVTYQPWVIDPTTLVEDRTTNLKNMIDAYLGYTSVSNVIYTPNTNPNRISIDFVDYKTVNAERIELFCNAREESPVYYSTTTVAAAAASSPTDSSSSSSSTSNTGIIPVFCCSEYIRQVTFGTGSTVGVPRQVGTNYAHFWTYKKVKDTVLTGNVLTAGYLDPNDALYFDEPTNPVVIYSHTLTYNRILL